MCVSVHARACVCVCVRVCVCVPAQHPHPQEGSWKVEVETYRASREKVLEMQSLVTSLDNLGQHAAAANTHHTAATTATGAETSR